MSLALCRPIIRIYRVIFPFADVLIIQHVLVTDSSFEFAFCRLRRIFPRVSFIRLVNIHMTHGSDGMDKNAGGVKGVESTRDIEKGVYFISKAKAQV